MPRENWAAGRTMSAYPNKHGKDKNKNKKNTMIMGIDEVKLNFSEYSRDTKGAISFLKQWRAKKDDTNAPRAQVLLPRGQISRGLQRLPSQLLGTFEATEVEQWGCPKTYGYRKVMESDDTPWGLGLASTTACHKPEPNQEFGWL